MGTVAISLSVLPNLKDFVAKERRVYYIILRVWDVSGGYFSSPPNVQPTQPITQKGGGVSIR